MVGRLVGVFPVRYLEAADLRGQLRSALRDVTTELAKVIREEDKLQELELQFSETVDAMGRATGNDYLAHAVGWWRPTSQRPVSR